jgi:hypothetical protein
MPTYNLVFPDGITQFTDKAGNVVTAGETGAVTVDASKVTEYLDAGCVLIDNDMATLIAAIIEGLADLALIKTALIGDMVFTVSPTTVNRTHTSAAWSRTVAIALKTAAGAVHTWFTGDITSGLSIADTSTAGTASITGTTLSIVNGEATVIVDGDAAAWLATETDTLTIEEATILGYTVAEATSVQTFT